MELRPLFDLIDDHLAAGVILLDRDGRVRFRNRAATCLLEKRSDLVVSGELLHGRKRAGAQLHRLIRSAASASDDLRGACTGLVVLDGIPGPVHVFVAPLGRGQQRMVAVALVEPGEMAGELKDFLMHSYEMTGAEARLASALAAGLTLRQAASDLRCSVSTLRWHLREVFAKTGTKRQTDLVRLLIAVSVFRFDLSLAPPVEGVTR